MRGAPAPGAGRGLLTPTRVKVSAFAMLSAVILVYGLTSLFQVQHLVQRPTTIQVVFADPVGIVPRSEVDLLGVPVGSVTEVRPGPGASSTVVVALDHGTRVPVDVHADAGSKSAIGEQYVELAPQSAGGPYLAAGATVPQSRTTSPPDLADLLRDTQSLVSSVPPGALRTVLREGALAFGDSAPQIRRILGDLDQLSASGLRHVDQTTTLIDQAQSVLDTQVAVSGRNQQALASLASLTGRLRALDPTFDATFVDGVAAGVQVTGLLRDNQAALPVLLDHLISLTDLGRRNLPGIRKALVIFPWSLEYNSQALRYCDKIDRRTGKAVANTCHYDSDGLPIWSAHIANITSLRDNATANPCHAGYQTTKRFLPNGRPVDGSGPSEKPDQPPNYRALCTAPPSDPMTPNVRGFQNIPVPGRRSSSSSSGSSGTPSRTGTAVLDPRSGTLVTPDGLPVQLTSTVDPVPPGADLGWLLTRNLVGR